MSLKLTLFSLFVLSLGTSCVGHAGHDEDQMPLGYVRFPYQATYPGDDSSQCFHHTLRPQECLTMYPSHCGCDLLWYCDLRKVALGTLFNQR